MSKKKSKEKTLTTVILEDLNVGIDVDAGTIQLGVVDKDGTIIPEKSIDFTEEFYTMVRVIHELQLMGRQQMEKKQTEKPTLYGINGQPIN